MKKLFLFCLLATSFASAQILIGIQTQSPTTGTITVSTGGTGTGAVTSNDSVINCPGSCTDTVALNTLVTLTATPAGGGTFGGWSGACGGTLTTCSVLVLGNNSVAATFLSAGGGGGALPAWPTFVIDPNQANHWPGPNAINTGGGRLWDSPNSQWVWDQTAACVAPFPCTSAYVFSGSNGVDSILGLMKTAGVTNAYMPVSRTPQSATSHTSASSCVEQTPTGNTGQCYPPAHLSADGSGTDQEWIDWVTALGTHVHAAGYDTTHAVLTAWESYNEPDTGCNEFYCGTYDQAVRMQEDLYFLIKGDANFVFTGIGTSGTGGIYTGTFPNCASNYCAGMRVNVTGMGNGGNNQTGKLVCTSTSTQLKLGTVAAIVGGANGALVTNSCTNVTTINGDSGGTLRFVETFPDGGGTYRTAAQVQGAAHSNPAGAGGVLSGPISTTDTVFMGSFHGGAASYTKANIWLYCNGGTASPTDPNQTACVSPSNAGSIFSDAMNWHYKPGCSGASMEPQLDTWVSGTQAILSSLDLTKPFWSTEGGFGQWVNCGTGPAGQPEDYTDALMKASFMGRWYTYSLLKEHHANVTWYNDSFSHGGTGSTQSDAAANTIFNWLSGGIPGAVCSTLTPGTAGTGDFTYQCPYTDASGNADLIVWDTSQSCTSPNCTTTSQTISGRFSGGPYTHYDTLVDGAAHNVSGGAVPVGITPIRLRP